MSDDALGAIMPVVLFFGLGGLAWLAGRRFERRRIKEGEWTKDGPLHPTDPPPYFLDPYRSGWAPPPPQITSAPADDEPGTEFAASVFLSSVLGYTATSSTIGASRSVELVNRIHQAVTEAVLAEDGVHVKYLGDGSLAYFAGEQHERRALRAAVAARDALKDQLVVSVASGTVLRADIGHAEHAMPDIMGDAVNAAFKLNAWAAKPSESRVVILGESARRLDDEFVMRELDWVNVKGMSETVTVFEVESART